MSAHPQDVSVDLYRIMVEASVEGIGISDSDRKLLMVNPALCRFLGYSEEYLVGRSFLEFTHPDDIENNTQRFNTLVSGKAASDSYEKRYIRSDGSTVWANLRVSRITGENGRDYFIANIEDITERKATKEKLKTSESLLQSFFRNASLGFALAGSDMIFVEVNQALADMIGYERSELIGKSILDIVPSDEAHDHIRLADELFQQKASEASTELQLLNSKGNSIWVHLSVSAVLDEQGKPCLIAGIIEDITDRKRDERRLLENEATIRALLNAPNDRLCLVDTNGVILSANQALADGFGMSTEEIQGVNPRDMMPEALYQERMKKLQHCAQSKQVIQFEDERAGTHFRSSFYPIINTEGYVDRIALVASDITDIKLEEERKLATEKALRDTLVREVHHRIKNHLQGIIGLLSQATTSGVPIKESLDTITKQIKSIAIVHGLQGSEGHGDIPLANLVRMITEALCQGLNVPYHLECPDDFDKTICVLEKDSVPIALVINELITNAIKHRSNTTPLALHLLGDKQSITFCISNEYVGEQDEFSELDSSGSGLKLVAALLPRDASHLSHTRDEGVHRACLKLEPPTLAGG